MLDWVRRLVLVTVAVLVAGSSAAGWGGHRRHWGTVSVSQGGSGTPVNTALPVITPMAPVVGAVETATTGTWTNSPTSYTCQWEYGTGANITGATSCSSYTPVTADIGQTLQIVVTAFNASGASMPATSGQTSQVVAPPTAYYVSNTGLDTNNGTSTSTPWQTPARVNCGPTGTLSGGSCSTYTTYPNNTTISFNGGQTFTGCLAFKGYPNGGYGPAVGNAANGMLTVASYSAGHAQLTSNCSGNFVAAVFLDGVNNFIWNGVNVLGGTVNDPVGTYYFFYNTAPTGTGVSAGGSPFTTGTPFIPNVAGNISGIRYYKPANEPTTSRNLILWSCTTSACTSGTNINQCTTSGEPTSGPISNVTCNFSSATTITVGNSYIVTADLPSTGSQLECGNGATCPINNNLPMSRGSPVYAAGLGTFPSTSAGANFFPIDPIYNTTAIYTFPLTNIGIEITNNCGTSCASSGITVENSTIKNFAAIQQISCEICIHGDSIPSGLNGSLDSISILNNTMGGTGGPTSADIAGVSGYGFGLNITNVLVQGNTVSNLGGYAGTNGYALGIDAGGWLGGTIQHNLVHDIGGNNGGHCGGPGGIETFQVNGVLIQYNEVYNVQPVPNTFPPPSGGCDWVAYDLDGGTENSTVQYNYSHNNSGAAWLAFTVDINGIQWGNNIFRFNVSENDDFLNTSNAIFAFGAPTEQNIQFYNNTMYSTTSLPTSASPIACIFQGFVGGAFANGSTINNNICYNTGTYQFGGTTYVSTQDLISNIQIANNVYYGGQGSISWKWNSTGYSTLASWQSACLCDASSTATTNPLLTNPGNGGTCSWTPSTGTGPQPCPSAYTLQTSSTTPSIGADLLVCPLGGSVATLGTTDYYGNSISILCSGGAPPTGVAVWGGAGTTYYVSAAGLDTNNGTSKATAWLHAPGMPNCTGTCASTTLTGGQNVVFRGGDTWHWGNSSAAPYVGGTWTSPTNSAGTSAGCNLESYASPVHTNCIYFGVDLTWSVGATWTRPIFNFDNPTSTASVTCTYDQSAFIGISWASYTISDNFEFTGICANQATVFGAGTYTKEPGIYVSQLNHYFHGWTENRSGGAGTDFLAAVFGTHGAAPSFNVHRYLVVDGSDTFCTGVNSCELFAFEAEGYDLDHSVITKVSNGIAGNTAVFSVHDNLFENMYESWDSLVHSNVTEANGIFSSDIPTFLYNNNMNTTNIGVGFWPEPYAHAYWFGNVVFGNSNGGNAGITDSEVGISTVDTRIFNNTVDIDTWIRLSSHGNYPGTLEYANNHLIGYSPANLASVYSGTPTNTPVDSGGELFQTEAVANGQGYIQGNNYAPTAPTNSTVGAGANLTSLCNGLSDATAAYACLHGSTAVSYFSPTHTVLLNDNSPMRPSGSWDVGAYQYSAAPVTDEFPGPFSTWTNVKTTYGAVGDGSTDDTTSIQNGLNALQAGTISVLYFPAGTYKITAGLTLTFPNTGAGWGGYLIGHNPSDTQIRWAGSVGGTMLTISEQYATKHSRITWNGASTAGVGVWQKTVSGGFSQNNWYNDDVFENAGAGLQVGNPGVAAEDSEVTCLRCQFLNNTSYGFQISNPNSVDMWTYFSTFTNNAVGVSNAAQQGNFSVWNSVFSGSTTADAEATNTEFYGLHNNYSSGSAQFLLLNSVGANVAQWTVINNTILDTTNTKSIQVAQPAQILFVGNTVRTKSGGAAPAVSVAATTSGGQVTSFNNIFTVSSPVSVTGTGSNLTENNDNIVSRANINPPAPSYSTPPNTSRTVYEVTAGSSAATIQTAINNAVAQQGSRPVVHLQAGSYNIATTISIPANLDVQIIGDGGHTNLTWTGGAGTGPMFKFVSPGKGSLQDVQLGAPSNNVTNLILVGTEDSAQARVQIWDVEDGNGHNCISTNGLVNTTVNVYGYFCSNATNGVSVTGPGGSVNASLNFFGTVMEPAGSVFSTLSGNGNILAEELWNQGSPAITSLSGTPGNLSIIGGVSGPNSAGSTFTLSSFSGTFTLVDWYFFATANQTITVTSPSGSTNALFMNDLMNYSGYWGVAAGGNVFGYNNSLNSSGTEAPTANQGGTPTNAFINNALGPMQSVSPTQNTVLPPGVTDVRLMNLWLNTGNTAILIKTGV